MSEKIYTAINAVMSEIDPIAKEKRNVQQNFMYRGIDDVMNALNPAFIKHKIFAVPEVLSQTREERVSSNNKALIYSICRVKYTFFADDGSHVNVVTIGEGMDSGDKATNKAMAVAFKYACFQLFCIPTEEMSAEDARPVDPDKESHEVKPANNANTGQKKSNYNVGDKDIDTIGNVQINRLYNECGRTGSDWKKVCADHGVDSFSKMTYEQYNQSMKELAKIPDKKEAPLKTSGSTVTAADHQIGLPFN